MLKRRKVTLITCTKVTVISPEGKKTSYSRVLKSQGSKRMAYNNQQNSSGVQECLNYDLKASSSKETDTLKTIQSKSKHAISSEISKSSHNGSSVKKECPECDSSRSFLTSSERDAPKMMTQPGGVHTMSSADSMTAQQQTYKTELWSKNMDKSCLGEDASNLKRNYGRNSLQNLTPSLNHTILVEVTSVRENNPPRAFKKMTPNAWNANYVKMPYSDHSSYEKRSFMGPKTVNRWEIIKKALMKGKFKDSYEVEDTIKKYNKKYEKEWSFSGLHSYLRSLAQEEKNDLLQGTLPFMASLALQLPDVCPSPIPLLRKGLEHTLTMSQRQIACLLANAFFCTFPHRNATNPSSEYSNYPDINFSRLFEDVSEQKHQKLRTIFWYFTSLYTTMPTGLVTFQRRCMKSEINWKVSRAKFTALHVTSEGKIEEQGAGMLQVDFASSKVGGGVLGSGLVQEEIRFLINTELIVARLFTEKLMDKECLIITGAQQYSRYSGYSDTFRWEGPHVDETPRDEWQRLCTEIVAIDALKFNDYEDQFKGFVLDRELMKAFCGFRCDPPQVLTAVATGNWGCGAFKGNAKFKALIQLMAAAEARRDVMYFTLGDKHLMKDLYHIHLFLKKQNFTVGKLFSLIEKFCQSVKSRHSTEHLYDYIYHAKL